MRQEDQRIFLVRELSPDFWHDYPDMGSEFLTPSLVVKTETSSKNLLLPQETLFPELNSKWTSPGRENVAGGKLQYFCTLEFIPLFDPL